MAKGSIDDEQALVKAAAWAWYQHSAGAGAGCDGRAVPVREFDGERTSSKSPCRPSRYKLEAMRRRNTSISMAVEEEDGSEAAAVGLSPTHTDMSLLDSYEIESISRQLKRILASAAAGSIGRGYLVLEAQAEEEGFGRRRQRRPPATSKKERDGFWARHAIGFCTSREDVVEAGVTTTTALGGGGGRRRRKSGSSARLAADFQFHQP
ncbi:hypothetical protein ACLOJK_007058 [Asimina triloba]